MHKEVPTIQFDSQIYNVFKKGSRWKVWTWLDIDTHSVGYQTITL